MSRGSRIALVVLLASCLAPAGAARADATLDWQVREAPAGPFVGWARGARDGVLGLLDAAMDLQLGAFSEASLLLGSALMAGSDTIGLVDDNPVTQHVFKATASKSLAKTAYLFHLAGAEAVLGSHGLESDWYLQAQLAQLNPLLDDADADPGILLDPLDFVSEGMVHTRVYTFRVPGRVLLASLAADGVLRPASCVLRVFGLSAPADALQRSADDQVRRAVD